MHKTIQGRCALIVLAIIWLLLAPACGNGSPSTPASAPTRAATASPPTAAASAPVPATETPTSQPASPAPTPVQAFPTPAPDPPPPFPDTPTPVPEASTPLPTQKPDLLILEIVEGTSARYLVKEQFARLDFPNDAIGETSAVSGSIRFRPDGTIDPAGSSFQVQLRGLRSDEDERDEFLWEESLESLKFSVAEFVLEQAPGLPWPLPQEGQIEFQLQGEMSIHGVTSPATWDATAQFTSPRSNRPSQNQF